MEPVDKYGTADAPPSDPDRRKREGMFNPRPIPEEPRPAPHPQDQQIHEWDPLGAPLSPSIWNEVKQTIQDE